MWIMDYTKEMLALLLEGQKKIYNIGISILYEKLTKKYPK